MDLADPTAFVRQNTRLNDVPLVPELRLYLADELVPLWQLTEKELSESGLPPPFWAFAWAGGQALARYLYDNPETVRGRRILDFASGCGIAGIAAAQMGATSVVAADIDPFATAASALNADRNGVSIQTTTDDLVGSALDRWDVIVTGDICYEQPLANKVVEWLTNGANRGIHVLIGDPGRTYLPKTGLEKLVSYAVKTTRELEDTDVRNTTVWRMAPEQSASLPVR